MHKKLVSFIKYNKLFLTLYRIIGNIGIKILSLFVPVNPKQILFMSFGGQKYDACPKAIYEKIASDPFFKDYRLIWSFTEPSKFDIKVEKVKTDSLKFYITALSSKIWINNSSVERGLHLKRNETIEINTWHGTPLKKLGCDINTSSGYYGDSQTKGKTFYCSQSEYDREIYSRVFNVSKENVWLCDLPRNDELVNPDTRKIPEIKKTLGIPQDKKIILYAPTFREFARDTLNCCYLKPPVDLEKWKKELGNEYFLLFRAHYEVINVLGISDNDFVKNVSSYPNLNDLFLITDILISDYSGTYFDFSVTGKPMLNFAYDYEEYSQKRGLYLDLKDFLPSCSQINYNEDTLIKEIKSMNEEEYKRATLAFKERFAPYAGKATQFVVDKLKDML